MKNLLTVIFFVSTFILSAQNTRTHKVKQGETMESIAKLYLVTPFDILALNPDAKTNFGPNTVLVIPDSKVKNDPIVEESKELIGYKQHKVKRKETLFGISQKYGVEIEEIKKANRYLYSENLKKGDRIKIPRYRTIISKQTLNNTIRKYTVQPKEGKWRVAYKFGITVTELEALNPNMNALLQPGDELNVPNIANNEEKPLDTAYNYYEVLPKEGFYRLKIKLGLTQAQLENLNPELIETGLKAGMVLKIPSDIVVSQPLDSMGQIQLTSKLNNFSTKKIALLMPYRLYRIDTDSIEETKEMIRDEPLLSAVLNFHEGVLMALDSAKQLGISTDLKVLDTEYRPSTVTKLLDINDFSEYSAVIGPMNPLCIDRVATVLQRDSIPLFVPLSKPQEVFPNMFQTIPNDEGMSKKMIDFVKNDSLKTKVVVIADEANRPTSEMLKREFPTAKLIYSRKNKKTEKDGNFLNPTDLEDVFLPGKTIVFLETDSNILASSVISMINAYITEDTEIVLVTLDRNKAFNDNIDNYHLSNLKFHYPSVNKNIDDESNFKFIKDYQNSHKVSPNRFVMRGFDLTLDILLRLASAENIYEASKGTFETEYIENKFRYNKTLFGGYINEAAYIVKYDDLKIIKVN